MSERVTSDPSCPLVEGQRLDQPSFHARCRAMPQGVRAELIGGVVLMPGAPSVAHGGAHAAALVWLDHYAEQTSGVELLDNAATVLGWKSEAQPDAQLRILNECGGRTRSDRGFIEGAPELVVEIAESTRYIDLGPKLADYAQAGVLEYVVRAFGPDEVVWFRQEQGSLLSRPPDDDGLYRSDVFPGLWLDPQALLAGDRRRLLAALERGLAAPEHAGFLTRLATAWMSG